MPLKKHRESYQFFFHDADRTGHASILSVCRYMQTAAMKHGKLAGTSIDHFSNLNLTWVFSRFHVRMNTLPYWESMIHIETWRSTIKKCFAFREFTVYDTDNNLIGAATSSLALIDKSTRKPVLVPDAVKEMLAPEFGRALNEDFGKLPQMTTAEHIKPFPVQIGDIDINDHVNNISYLNWIIEGLPANILLNYRPVEIEAEYRAEAFFGQTIISQSSHLEQANDKVFMHRLVRDSDGTETTRARTVWR